MNEQVESLLAAMADSFEQQCGLIKNPNFPIQTTSTVTKIVVRMPLR